MDKELSSEEVGRQLAQKSLRELDEAKIRQSRPKQMTRAGMTRRVFKI